MTGWWVPKIPQKRDTVAQIDEKVHVDSDKKVSDHTVHHSLLRIRLHCCRRVKVPVLTTVRPPEVPVTATSELVNGAMDESRFPFHHEVGRMCVPCLAKKERWHQDGGDSLEEEVWWSEWWSAGKLWFLYSRECYVDMSYLPKHCCRSS